MTSGATGEIYTRIGRQFFADRATTEAVLTRMRTAEYDIPANLDRLRSRGLGRKRSLAVREFVLGKEALDRFVAREPLQRVHEAVLGILALKSEPVDPRL